MVVLGASGSRADEILSPAAISLSGAARAIVTARGLGLWQDCRMFRAVLILAALLPAVAMAGEPRVTAATATREGATWRFEVTVAHADTGWEHYADGWEIATPDGSRLGYRELLHPHVTEQPFTRSLGGVAIPAELGRVTIRAHDSLHGWGEPFVPELGN